MTEYEMIDAFVSFQSLMQGWITTYFSGLTAYLLTAYLVGARLGRSQALIITACFFVFCALCTYAATGNQMRMLELATEVRALNPARLFQIRPWLAGLTSATMSAGVLVSLKFMWDVRHPRAG